MTVLLGFAGAGWLGEAMIARLPRVPGLVLGAIQDANVEIGRAVADRHGAARFVAAFEDLVRIRELDAIVISTPNAFHAQQAIAALRAGKHVLVQKPLATTAPLAREVADAAVSAGRLLFVDYSYRFLETTAAFFVAARALGPASLRAEFHNVHGPGKPWAYDPALAGGGALVDLGVHLVDLALALVAPHEVELRRVELSSARGFAVEDAASCALRMDGVDVDIDVSWEARLPRSAIAIRAWGERGSAGWENVDGSFFRFRATRGDELLMERETTLREDTLRAFEDALRSGVAPQLDLRTYELLDRAYGRV